MTELVRPGENVVVHIRGDEERAVRFWYGVVVAVDRLGLRLTVTRAEDSYGRVVPPTALAPGHRVLPWSTIGGIAVEVEHGTE